MTDLLQMAVLGAIAIASRLSGLLKRVARIDRSEGCRTGRLAAQLGGRNTGAKASAAVGSQPLRRQSNRPPGDARHGNWVVRMLTSPVTRPN